MRICTDHHRCAPNMNSQMLRNFRQLIINHMRYHAIRQLLLRLHNFFAREGILAPIRQYLNKTKKLVKSASLSTRGSIDSGRHSSIWKPGRWSSHVDAKILFRPPICNVFSCNSPTRIISLLGLRQSNYFDEGTQRQVAIFCLFPLLDP